MLMLFNQFIDMPHLSGGWIILANDKYSVTGMYRFEINKLFCVWNISGIFYFTRCNMGLLFSVLAQSKTSLLLSLVCPVNLDLRMEG